jgi:hypothetical protein
MLLSKQQTSKLLTSNRAVNEGKIWLGVDKLFKYGITLCGFLEEWQ